MKKFLAIFAVIFCVVLATSCEKEPTFTESIVGTSWTAEIPNGSITLEFVSPTQIQGYETYKTGERGSVAKGTYKIFEQESEGFIDIEELLIKCDALGHSVYNVFDFKGSVVSDFKHNSQYGDYVTIKCKWGAMFADERTSLLFFKN